MFKRPPYTSTASDYDPSTPITPGYSMPLSVLNRDDERYQELPVQSPGVVKREFLSSPTFSQEEEQASDAALGPGVDRKHGWIPIPLRPWFIYPWIVFNVLGAVAIEVALYFSNQNQGWGVISQDLMFSSAHFIYTVPSAAIALIMTSGWSFLDEELKKLQPYVSLSQGRSPAKQSVLLDYREYNKFTAWIAALYFGHTAAFFSSVVALIVLVVSPLASGFFVVRNTGFIRSANVSSYAVVGLDADYPTLTPFVTAAGYAEASALYNLASPPFIKGGWTVGQFQIPTGMNGTISVNTTAFLTNSQCQAADSVSLQTDDGGYNLFSTWNNCTSKIDIHTTATTQYGVNVVSGCELTNSIPDQYKPVMFWIYDYSSTQPQASVTYCDPTLEVYQVLATADMSTGLLLNASIIGSYTQQNNVTGSPMNMQPFNGIAFNLTNPDQYVLARANATQSGLPGAIWQTAAESNVGLLGTFALGDEGFLNLTDRVYTQFLALVAREVYFLEADFIMSATIVQDVQRLWITPYAAHTLAGVLLFAAVLGMVIHITHVRARRHLHLMVKPGTIGVTASMSRELEKMLHGLEDEKHLERTLKDQRFRLDERGIIVVDSV